MTVLVVAEVFGGKLQKATKAAVAAAQALGGAEVLVACPDAMRVAKQAAALKGVKRVLACDADFFDSHLPEDFAPLAARLAQGVEAVAFGSGAFGKNVAPRTAALLDCPMVSDVTEILGDKTFVHPIYAGNAYETVTVSSDRYVFTVRPTAFDAAAEGGDAPIEETPAPKPASQTKLIRFIEHKSARPELTQADVVVSGGRGCGSKENFEKIIFSLADKLGAAVGASRAAVDANFTVNDNQVGQTGKIVAPSLYIAVGVSGAIQHIAGMQDSKVIVAINKDPDAAIFKHATYGLVADLNEAVPELVSKL